MRCAYFIGVCLGVAVASAPTAGQTLSTDELTRYTAPWSGERFEDGQPMVSDAILARMENVSIENAWSVVRGEGYHHQFEGGWMMTHDDRPIIGRALTAEYMPHRSDAVAKHSIRNQQNHHGNGYAKQKVFC